MLYTLFLWIYISFSLNGHIKTKNGYFHKILKNNRDKQLFFCLMPIKSESLKISSQTTMIFTIQESHCNQIDYKKLNFSKLLVNLIYCGTYHQYSVVILVFTFH
jgi:hypothetical protein